MQTLHLFIQPFVINSCYFCCRLHTIAWLTVLDGKQPTAFDNDTGLKV